MGQLDDAVNEAVPGGNFAKTLLIAVGALILGKMFSGGKHEEAPAPAPAPAPQQQSGGGGLLGELGGLLAGAAGGAAAGGALSGGLGQLVDQFRNAGMGQKADSWVGTGQNMPITADEIRAVERRRRMNPVSGPGQARTPPACRTHRVTQCAPRSSNPGPS